MSVRAASLRLSEIVPVSVDPPSFGMSSVCTLLVLLCRRYSMRCAIRIFSHGHVTIVSCVSHNRSATFQTAGVDTNEALKNVCSSHIHTVTYVPLLCSHRPIADCV